MKKVIRFLLIFTTLFSTSFLFVNEANAAEIRTGEGNVVVEEYINDDLYVTGGTITVQDDVNGDVIASGGQVTIEDDVYGDIYVFGGMIKLEGDVRGNVIAGGGQVTIEGNVGGDVTSGGGMVILDGNVEDDVRIGAGTVNVNSEEIGGDLLLSANNGSVSSDTLVKGDRQVRYDDSGKISLESLTNYFNFTGRNFTNLIIKLARKLMVLVGWLIVGWLLLKFAPVKSRKVIDMLSEKNSSLKGLLVGFISIVVLLLLSPLLLAVFVLGIGQPALQVGGALFALAASIGGIYSSTAVVRLIMKSRNSKYDKYLLPMLIGVTIYQLLGWIPWIFCCMGTIVKIVMTTWGIGGVLLCKWDMISKKK
jgi:hypothetical protein